MFVPINALESIYIRIIWEKELLEVVIIIKCYYVPEFKKFLHGGGVNYERDFYDLEKPVIIYDPDSNPGIKSSPKPIKI